MVAKQGKLFITQGYCRIIDDGAAERIYMDGKKLGDLISTQLGILPKKRGIQRTMDLGEIRVWVERVDEEL